MNEKPAMCYFILNRELENDFGRIEEEHTFQYLSFMQLAYLFYVFEMRCRPIERQLPVEPCNSSTEDL